MFSTRMSRGLWAAALMTALAATGPAVRAAAQKNQKAEAKVSKEERQDVEATIKLVDGVMSGQPGADAQAFTINWHNDFLKALDGKIYVPFVITLDRTALTTRSVTFYVRVVSRAAADAPTDTTASKTAAKPPDDYAFQDAWLVDLKEPTGTDPYRVSRAFAVPAGEYDVYVAIRERTKDKKVAPRASVLKQPTSIPDYWNGQLTTSSLILAQTVEQLTAPLSGAEQLDHPYTIGQLAITPSLDHTFSKKDELSVLFLVYNPALAEKKPDVTVEYKFHQKTADGEKYFNRTPPTELNAKTLPADFDLDTGNQLVAGQSVPLASFPEGDYRLEIEVQDKLAQKTLTRDVFFTVTGS